MPTDLAAKGHGEDRVSHGQAPQRNPPSERAELEVRISAITFTPERPANWPERRRQVGEADLQWRNRNVRGSRTAFSKVEKARIRPTKTGKCDPECDPDRLGKGSECDLATLADSGAVDGGTADVSLRSAPLLAQDRHENVATALVVVKFSTEVDRGTGECTSYCDWAVFQRTNRGI